jgi:hypothetical protein
MERHICLFSLYGPDVYSAVHYIQMPLFHIQHELIYEREQEKENGTTNEERDRKRYRTTKRIQRKRWHVAPIGLRDVVQKDILLAHLPT